MWKYTGKNRPHFANKPKKDQESVWDYPRPPAIVADGRLVEVKVGKAIIASTMNAVRVLETASPPTFYLPPESINSDLIMPLKGSSFCEWKGRAAYLGLENGKEPIGWFYSNPTTPFASIEKFVSFYPGRVECYVAGERVRPQPGYFYGGWLTDEIVGPVKGESGTGGW